MFRRKHMYRRKCSQIFNRIICNHIDCKWTLYNIGNYNPKTILALLLETTLFFFISLREKLPPIFLDHFYVWISLFPYHKFTCVNDTKNRFSISLMAFELLSWQGWVSLKNTFSLLPLRVNIYQKRLFYRII